MMWSSGASTHDSSSTILAPAASNSASSKMRVVPDFSPLPFSTWTT